MQNGLIRIAAVLSLVLVCHSVRAQTFSFSTPQKVTTGESSQAGYAWTSTAVDINGSGNTDFVVSITNGGVNENVILMGDGDGGFVLTKSNVPSPNQGPLYPPLPWTFVDTNRDGYADTVTYNGGSYVYANGCQYDQTQNGRIYVSLGDGHGNFTLNPAATMEMEPATSISGAVGDFNGDGLMDVALLTSDNQLCAPNYSFLYILLNNGDGTFALRTVPMHMYAVGTGIQNLVTGDFNGDGKLDLAFLGQATPRPSNTKCCDSPIQVLYGNGDGTFQTGPLYKVDTTTRFLGLNGILAADLNGDGRTDLLVLAEPGLYARIITLLAKRTGGFYWYSETPVPPYPTLLGLMDLNNDGKLDLPYYIYDPVKKITSLRVFPGLGGGKFGASSFIRNTVPNRENDIIAPLKIGGPLDIFYALSYPPNKNVYLYEMLNQSK